MVVGQGEISIVKLGGTVEQKAKMIYNQIWVYQLENYQIYFPHPSVGQVLLEKLA